MEQDKKWGLIDAYKPIEECYDNKYPSFTERHSSKWMECPNCGEKPRLWEFDNGRFAACKCAKMYGSENYVTATNIGKYVRENNGSALGYPELELRDNWNDHCKNLQLIKNRNEVIDNL